MSNNQLTVVAKILAKPEKREFVKSELLKLIAPTLKETGCINYDLHQDNENENLFLFYENWSSRELWLKHTENSHISEFKRAAEDAIEESKLFEMTVIG